MLRIGRFAFAPRLLPTLAAAAFIALTVSLARWQMHRAEEKERLQALYESRYAEAPVVLTGAVPSAEPLLYRRVRARGRWIAPAQIFIDNQVSEGRAGFHVVTPLRIAGASEAVLVNRGWIARGPEYPQAPAVAVPQGDVEVQGIAALPPRRYLELSAETQSGNVWQNLSIERYARATGIAVLPVVVLADVPAPGLSTVRERPDTGVERHREYMLTWSVLAATALVLWIALNVRRVS
jgi:surfeit locus 1 family protein